MQQEVVAGVWWGVLIEHGSLLIYVNGEFESLFDISEIMH